MSVIMYVRIEKLIHTEIDIRNDTYHKFMRRTILAYSMMYMCMSNEYVINI